MVPSILVDVGSSLPNFSVPRRPSPESNDAPNNIPVDCCVWWCSWVSCVWFVWLFVWERILCISAFSYGSPRQGQLEGVRDTRFTRESLPEATSHGSNLSDAETQPSTAAPDSVTLHCENFQEEWQHRSHVVLKASASPQVSASRSRVIARCEAQESF